MCLKGLQQENQDSPEQYENHWTLTLTAPFQPGPCSALCQAKGDQQQLLPSPTPPPSCLHHPVALGHLSLAGHTWVLQRDVNLGSDDVVALLQSMGCHRCPLAAGVNEQDISLTDTLRILPWERRGEEERKVKPTSG